MKVKHQILNLLKCTSPIIGISMPAFGPYIFVNKLKEYLNDVQIVSAEIDSERGFLSIKGVSGRVRTSCVIYPISRKHALPILYKWAKKQRLKKNTLKALPTKQFKRMEFEYSAPISIAINMLPFASLEVRKTKTGYEIFELSTNMRAGFGVSIAEAVETVRNSIMKLSTKSYLSLFNKIQSSKRGD